MSPYDERNDGMAKNKPIKGSANAITETKIIVRRYFLVFSAETYTASIFCSRASIFCRISESSISILFIWGDRRGSNPQPPGPQPGTLPLSYGRHTDNAVIANFAPWRDIARPRISQLENQTLHRHPTRRRRSHHSRHRGRRRFLHAKTDPECGCRDHDVQKIVRHIHHHAEHRSAHCEANDRDERVDDAEYLEVQSRIRCRAKRRADRDNTRCEMHDIVHGVNHKDAEQHAATRNAGNKAKDAHEHKDNSKYPSHFLNHIEVIDRLLKLLPFTS